MSFYKSKLIEIIKIIEPKWYDLDLDNMGVVELELHLNIAFNKLGLELKRIELPIYHKNQNN